MIQRKNSSNSNNSTGSFTSIKTGVKNIVIADNNDNNNKTQSNEETVQDLENDKVSSEKESVSKGVSENINEAVIKDKSRPEVIQPLASEKVQGLAVASFSNNKNDNSKSDVNLSL